MSLFSFTPIVASAGFRVLAVLSGLLFLSACQFQPLHGPTSNTYGASGSKLSAIEVSQAYNRVGQQVRNHLVFLFTGGNPSPQKTHEARIRVKYNNNVLAAINDPAIQDSSAGIVTVSVSYDLIDKTTGKSIATGSRQAKASYDRTGQVFANERAERDAEDRAAREAAEALRLAIAADMEKFS